MKSKGIVDIYSAIELEQIVEYLALIFRNQSAVISKSGRCAEDFILTCSDILNAQKKKHLAQALKDAQIVELENIAKVKKRFRTLVALDLLEDSQIDTLIDRLEEGGRLFCLRNKRVSKRAIRKNPSVRHNELAFNGKLQAYSYSKLHQQTSIGLLPDGSHACAQIRTLGLLEYLAKRKDIKLSVLKDKKSEAYLTDFDYLVLQRYGGKKALQLMLSAKRLGIPVSVDLDDDFINLPWYNPNADTFKRFPESTLLKAILSGANQLIVSTPALKEAVLEYNPNIQILRNVVDTELFSNKHPKEDTPIRIGYIGTATHQEDLKPVIPALKKLIEEYKGRVELVFIGDVPTALQHHEHVRYLGWFNAYHNAAYALSHAGIHLAIAPLLDIRFNHAKSEMKFLEYGASGIVGVFSDLPSYRNVVRDGENGVLVPEHTTKAWFDALKSLIDDPMRIEKMSLQARKDVEKRHSLRLGAKRFLKKIIETPLEKPATIKKKNSYKENVFLLIDQEKNFDDLLWQIKQLRVAIPANSNVVVFMGDDQNIDFLNLGNEIVAKPIRDFWPTIMDVQKSKAIRLFILESGSGFDTQTCNRLSISSRSGVISVAPSLMRNTWDKGIDCSYQSFQQNSKTREIPWLSSACVLIDIPQLRALGGFDASLEYCDALIDLAFRARQFGLKNIVSDEAAIIPASRKLYYSLPERRSKSRIALGKKHKEVFQALSTREEELPVAFGACGEKLAVWLFARSNSTYLKASLRSLIRQSDLPYELHIICDKISAIDKRYALDIGAKLHFGIDVKIAEHLYSNIDADFLLALHDGVFLSSNTLARMLLFALKQENRSFFLPYANSGYREQIFSVQRSAPFEKVMSETESDVRFLQQSEKSIKQNAKVFFEKGFNVGLFRIRSLGEKGLAAIDEATIVPRTYAHILSSPQKNGPFGFWNEKPIEKRKDSAQELKELRKRLEENPFDSSALIHISAIYRHIGEHDEANRIIEKTKKIDPFLFASQN